MTSFAGWSVLVAGGTGGLGRAVALAFLEAGAYVSVTFRNAPELEALRDAAGPARDRLDGYAVDVTDERAAIALVEACRARRGRIDVLVNTVGGFAGGKPLWESDPDLLERMLALNLRSAWALARAVVPLMRSEGRGAI
ncbi:MAG TPA: SDR family oxidoreductase, partial [Thermoanaerobaculia bacterium]|nr:SDR family oxidoreductase [Thermoanaerobaculia bacterium]